MDTKNKVLALITAREGSKRLPGKNVRLLGDIPLLSWTIREAKKSKYLDRIVLSTNDSTAVEIANQEGCEVPFIRPDYLSTDHATSFDVAKHVLENVAGNYEWLVLLQPTSPFRKSEDIDECINLAISKNYDSVMSIVELPHSYLMNLTLLSDGKIISPYGLSIERLNHTRSQDMPKTYQINGAVYVVKIKWFLEKGILFDGSTRGYIMPSDRSINIDTQDDWDFAEYNLRNILKGN